jgi:hypothetical protein
MGLLPEADLPSNGEQMLCWRGWRDDTDIIACALRLPVGWPLDGEQVRLWTAKAAGSLAHATPAPGVLVSMPTERPAVLITTATATAAATSEAERLGVRLLARQEVTALLDRLAGAHRRERETIRGEVQERARAATLARRAIIGALKAHEMALAKPGAARSASTRSAVAVAVDDITAARKAAERALLAWETLVADWQASFGARPEWDGTLAITGEPARFAEQAQRAAHLREAMAGAIARLQRTPAEGELGYGEWRRQVMEELASHCTSLRVRTQSIEPAQWQDFARARDLEAEAAATRATTAAERAAARGAQLYGLLAERVGLAR